MLVFCGSALHPTPEFPLELSKLKLVLARALPGRELSPLPRPHHFKIKTNHPSPNTKQSLHSPYFQPTPTPAGVTCSKALPSSE